MHRISPLFGIMLLLLSSLSLAKENLIVSGKTIINKSVIYKNLNIDMTHGYFQVENNATIEMENCVIHGVISRDNPGVINLIKGNITLKNNQFIIRAVNLPLDPVNSPIYNLIHMRHGKAMIMGNTFSVDKLYSIWLFVCDGNAPSDVNISNNKITHFHGGILLKHTMYSQIVNNQFSYVSLSNIFVIAGGHHLIKNNVILFSGNNNVGDGIDLIDTDDIILKDNYIFSGSCYSIAILRSKNILIEHNIVAGGITYAIAIMPSLQIAAEEPFNDTPLLNSIKKENAFYYSQNIKIMNNYFAQNRYGLMAIAINGLVVKNNVFVQRFSTHKERKFWTNNHLLLNKVSNITWENNRYKEAFAQDASGNETATKKFVIFPLYGGVDL